jgi:peptidyl-prolyl cis-trans isomerase A (cyclophilin A)
MRARATPVVLSLLALLVPGAAAQRPSRPSLMNPATVMVTAPAVFRARFDNSHDTFIIEVHRDWAPHAADRFYSLVRSGFYDGCFFFRVLPYFMVQFGINGDPRIQAAWRNTTIADDPVKLSNTQGTATFVMTGKNTRTTQVFINYRDNAFLDAQGFAPFGKVVQGMQAVLGLEGEYRDRPDQKRIEQEGNKYLIREFPRLSIVMRATIEK